MTAPVLKVSLRYAVGAFDLDVELQVDGGVTALVGPSGAGKTTLLDLVAGLREPSGGHISLSGRALYDSSAGVDLAPRQRRVGYVFQDDRLFPHKSVEGNLRYGYDRLPPERRRHQPNEIIDLLELGPMVARRPAGLSGGERRRVAIGRALLASPELLLLDEPLTGLHPEMRAQVTRLLRRVREELGAPMLYVTHRAEDFEDLATAVIHMDRGRVVTGAS